jgi:hypothetical protein
VDSSRKQHFHAPVPDYIFLICSSDVQEPSALLHQLHHLKNQDNEVKISGKKREI